ncbi:hypothetical protein HanIR_Chr12g0598901 [Helianthus annuus]|nr:hypothetical protein HanIR_Chr12g0598901 [Helianthus annuus]
MLYLGLRSLYHIQNLEATCYLSKVKLHHPLSHEHIYIYIISISASKFITTWFDT